MLRRRPYFQPFSTILGRLAVLCIGLCAAVAKGDSSECRRVALAPSPTWSMSATWNPAGEELFIVDLLGAKILRFEKGGRHLGTIDGVSLGRFHFDHPTHLVVTSAGYLVVNRSTRLIWFDRDFKPVRYLDLLMTRSVSRIKGPPVFRRLDVASLLQIGDQVVTYGPVLMADRLIERAWVRLNVPTGELTGISEEVELDLRGLHLELLTSTLLAHADGAAYALRLVEPPFIAQITPDRRQLRAFPQGFEKLPALPERRGAAAAAIQFKALEQATVPLALYGRGSFLYLLTRQPGSEGKTRWRVSQIDPRRDTLIRTLELPTRANHVVLAPGAQFWAVIEKGPVIASGKQEIPSMLLIPAAWIEDPDVTALTRNDVVCQ